MIDQGVTAALTARDANRNGDDSHTLGTGNAFGRGGTLTLRYYSGSCQCIEHGALKKMMTDKYCPRGEIKKIEFEMWNLKVKGTDVVTYNHMFS
ncbi:hypothetical protein Tco_1219538 [Tanacetum coccineum]